MDGQNIVKAADVLDMLMHIPMCSITSEDETRLLDLHLVILRVDEMKSAQ